MIHNTTSATPRLDWVRSHLVLALQELQGWVDEWQALILGEVPATRVIAMLRHDLIPSDIEYDGLGLDLTRLINEIWRCRHNGVGSVLPDNEFVTPLVEAVLSYYAADGMPSLQLRDCEAVWEVAHWLLADKHHSPRVRRFLSAAADLYAPIRP